MKDTQNIALVLLAISAAILTTLLVAGYLYTEPAYGATTAVKDGDYMIAVGSYNQDTEFLYILDIAKNRLNLYYVNINTNAVTLRDSVELSRVFRP